MTPMRGRPMDRLTTSVGPALLNIRGEADFEIDDHLREFTVRAFLYLLKLADVRERFVQFMLGRVVHDDWKPWQSRKTRRVRHVQNAIGTKFLFRLELS